MSHTPIREPRSNRRLRPGASLLLVLLLTGSFLVGGCGVGESDQQQEATPAQTDTAATAEQTNPRAVSIWQDASVRSSAGDEGEYVTGLNLGESVRLLGETQTDTSDGETQTYSKVRLQGGEKGWVQQRLIAKNPAAVRRRATLHERPTAMAGTEKEFQTADIVAILDEQDAWVKVQGKRHAGQWLETGWVRREAVTRQKEDITVAALWTKAMAKEESTERSAALEQIVRRPPYRESTFMDTLRASIDSLRVQLSDARILSSSNPQEDGRYGTSILSTPDVNGDGTQDWLIGALEAVNEGWQEGRTYVHSGVDGRMLRISTSPNPIWAQRYGFATATLEDVDGDESPDFLIGAPPNRRETTSPPGKAYVVSGGKGNVLETFSSPEGQKSDNFGKSVAAMSDISGDGINDLVIAAPKETVSGTERAGRVYLFSGKTERVLEVLKPPKVRENGRFGQSIAVIEDADGDGTPGVLAGTWSGKAYLLSSADGTVLQTFASPSSSNGVEFGGPVARMPDVTGDDVPDILIGAPGDSVSDRNSAGRVHVFSGADGRLVQSISSPNPEKGGQFGSAVAGTSDLTGDETGDILVGASETVLGLEGAGRVYLFSGSTGDLIQMFESPLPDSNGAFGSPVWGVWDNFRKIRPFAGSGDSTRTVVIGAPGEQVDGIDGAGRAYMFSLSDSEASSSSQ